MEKEEVRGTGEIEVLRWKKGVISRKCIIQGCNISNYTRNGKKAVKIAEMV